MQTRRFGRTDHHCSVAVLGGAAFWNATSDEAGEWLHRALDAGVNQLDIAPRYGDAEVAVGPHIPAVRDKLFITEKTGRANADGVRAQLDETLTRLQTDHVDVYQLHGVTSVDELDRRSEAVTVLQEAKADGRARFIGITGHDLGSPAAHLEALHRYDLDTVMFPIYPKVWADPQYRADAEALLAECERRDVGVVVIKAVARRPWPDATRRWDGPWYEPEVEPDAIARGVRFALSTPGVHAFATPGDRTILGDVLAAANGYEPLDEAEREAALAAQADEDVIFPLLERAAPMAGG